MPAQAGASPRHVRSLSPHLAIHHESSTTAATFTNSDGWIVMPATRIQRVAPRAL